MVPLISLRREALPDPPLDHLTAQGIVHSVDRGCHFGNESRYLLWQKHPGKKLQSLCSSPWSHLVTPALPYPSHQSFVVCLILPTLSLP